MNYSKSNPNLKVKRKLVLAKKKGYVTSSFLVLLAFATAFICVYLKADPSE